MEPTNFRKRRPRFVDLEGGETQMSDPQTVAVQVVPEPSIVSLAMAGTILLLRRSGQYQRKEFFTEHQENKEGHSPSSTFVAFCKFVSPALIRAHPLYPPKISIPCKSSPTTSRDTCARYYLDPVTPAAGLQLHPCALTQELLNRRKLVFEQSGPDGANLARDSRGFACPDQNHR